MLRDLLKQDEWSLKMLEQLQGRVAFFRPILPLTTILTKNFTQILATYTKENQSLTPKQRSRIKVKVSYDF